MSIFCRKLFNPALLRGFHSLKAAPFTTATINLDKFSNRPVNSKAHTSRFLNPSSQPFLLKDINVEQIRQISALTAVPALQNSNKNSGLAIHGDVRRLEAGGVLVPTAGDHGSLYTFGPGLVTLWTLILSSNLIGLAGYAVGPTVHLAIVFPTALSFWLSIIASSVQWSPNNFFAHLVPTGSPLVLAPFMSVIEAVSIAIRPITLSVRLVANLSAGHLILGLIGGGVVSGTLLTQSLALGVSTGYVAFEVFVACIQTYIFCNLLALYAEEHA